MITAENINIPPVVFPEDAEEQYLGPSLRCVLFELDNEIYGINVKKIREVLRVSTIRKVEGASYNVLGVINVRGVIVTVVDTRLTFRLNAKEVDDFSRIIIVEMDDENIVGMMVDSVMEVRDIPETKFETLSQTKEGAPRYIQGIAHYQGKVIILIDTDSVFNR